MSIAAESTGIPVAELTAIVRRALDAPDAVLQNWRATPLVHRVINGVTGGLQRVAGTALVGEASRSWSVVLKVLRAGAAEAIGTFSPSADPRHWNYWRREPLLYASGLLDGFPAGLAVPRCLGTSEPADGEVWLWLEEIAGVPARAWSPEQFGLAARRLGQWQGGFAAGIRPLPDAPWLSEGWLRAWVPDARGARLELARDPAAWRHPLLGGIPDSGALVAEIAALWRDRDALLDAIERMPLTFCHRDLWAANLFARPDARGADEIVVIDWSMSGNGVLADDVANLAFDSVWMQQVDADLPAFARLILDKYCLGLRDGGWRGDEGAVRATFAAIAALRFGLLAGGLLAFVHDEVPHATWAARYGRPIAAISARRVAVVTHALALADQGRALLR